jgi:hypothetical protein
MFSYLSILSFFMLLRDHFPTCLVLLTRRDSVVALSMAFLTPTTTTAEQNLPARPPFIRWGIIGLGDVTRQKSGPPLEM